MADATLLDEVRKVLRITSNAFDSEIDVLINSCKKDLGLAGVERIDEADPLIMRAIMLYVKANFGYEENPERYQKPYDALRLSLRESGDYRA